MYRLITLLLMTILAVSGAQAAKMYRWVDEKGVTHFSKRPPPNQYTDQTRLKGGSVTQPRSSTKADDLARIKAVNLENPGWQGCASKLCQLVQRFDPECHTTYCSRAKHFTNRCTSAACQTKKIAFEKDVQDRIEIENRRRQEQAINANTTPTPN